MISEKVSDTFNKFFVKIGNISKVGKDKRFLRKTSDMTEPALKAIKNYSAHTSILSIKEKINNNVFSFRNVTHYQILNEINNLDTSNSTQSEDISLRYLKIMLTVHEHS